MSLSSLPLSYCTNVHPGRSLAEVEDGLDRFTVPVRQAHAHPVAAGLWLARAVVAELLSDASGVVYFAERLARRGLTCHTLNAFPFGDFHSERVKEDVYQPDWSSSERLRYTIDCARVLAGLLPDGVNEGSISTLPLGFSLHAHSSDFRDQCARQIIACAAQLARIQTQTGKTIRLAIEPEPLCLIETTPQILEWFEFLSKRAPEVKEHIGVCFDVCHQAVEFEDVAESIRMLRRADIRINKIHASCALQLDDPMQNVEGRAALHRFVEPRYLHQVFSDTMGKAVDLTHELIDAPDEIFRSARSWRVHFHVPVDAERIGPLQTTREQLKAALHAVAQLDYAPHIEVETYTWDVLPGNRPNLAEGLTQELNATRELLAEVAGRDKMPAATRKD